MCFFAAGPLARSLPQGAGAKYQVVKVCSLLSLAEVKKLAPWPPERDASVKPKEEAFGSDGSSCDYPKFLVVVRAFHQSSFDSMRKAERMEAVSGVGDEAYVRDVQGAAGELSAKVGPHMLGVVFTMESNETFESTKPTLIAIGKASSTSSAKATGSLDSRQRPPSPPGVRPMHAIAPDGREPGAFVIAKAL